MGCIIISNTQLSLEPRCRGPPCCMDYTQCPSIHRLVIFLLGDSQCKSSYSVPSRISHNRRIDNTCDRLVSNIGDLQPDNCPVVVFKQSIASPKKFLSPVFV